MIAKKSKLRLYFRAWKLQKSTSINFHNFQNNFKNEIVKMALKSLKRPKTEFLNQSSEVGAPTTSNDFEWQREVLASLSDDERMEYEERAAIMEFDGELLREEVERQVLERILEKRGDLNGKNRCCIF
jgi:hypothetical protein